MDNTEIQIKILGYLHDKHYGGEAFKEFETDKIIHEIFPGEDPTKIYPIVTYLDQKGFISGSTVLGYTYPIMMRVTIQGIDYLEELVPKLRSIHSQIRYKILKFLSEKYFAGETHAFFNPQDIIKEVDFSDIPETTVLHEFLYLKQKNLINGLMTIGTTYPRNVSITAHGIDNISNFEESITLQSANPNTKWDVFISHASEDKNDVANPLAAKLNEIGLTVWYDQFTLKWGDSLMDSINNGLKNSLFGVVILSQSFFGKKWPETELKALFSLATTSGEKKILPLRYRISHDEVVKYSPLLSDTISRSWDEGLDNLAKEVKELVEEKRKA